MTLQTTPEVWYTHRVSYGETDTMGVLYYAEYLHIFERGRSAFIRAFGLSYKEVEERGLFLPVREARCRYRSPARYDDLVHLRSTMTDWRKASLVFQYELWNEDKSRMLAEGFTHHACVNRQGQPVAAPEWFKSLFL